MGGNNKQCGGFNGHHDLEQTLAQLLRVLLARFRLLAAVRGRPHFEKMVPPIKHPLSGPKDVQMPY